MTLSFLKKFLLHIFIAPWSVSKIACKIKERKLGRRISIWWYAVPSVMLFSLFILFHILDLVIDGFWAMGWFLYFCFCCYVAAIRFKIREIVGIHGSGIEDFLSCVLLYPSVSVQIEETFKNIIFIESTRKTNIENDQICMDDFLGKRNEGYIEDHQIPCSK